VPVNAERIRRYAADLEQLEPPDLTDERAIAVAEVLTRDPSDTLSG
jgi:hypothetical protein